MVNKKGIVNLLFNIQLDQQMLYLYNISSTIGIKKVWSKCFLLFKKVDEYITRESINEI